jgi:hypothetical protein
LGHEVRIKPQERLEQLAHNSAVHGPGETCPIRVKRDWLTLGQEIDGHFLRRRRLGNHRSRRATQGQRNKEEEG